MNVAPGKTRSLTVKVTIARRLDDLMEVFALRSVVYMAEQACPYEEEFDGNDFVAATHLIARRGREPVGTMRIRWFAEFAKVERVAVRSDQRGGEIAAALIKKAIELTERKGYRKILGHIQARLLPYWKRAGGVRERLGRPRFIFSDFEYVEVERDLTPPANAIGLSTPAHVVLRPEGDWDRPGVLDRSKARQAKRDQRAA